MQQGKGISMMNYVCNMLLFVKTHTHSWSLLDDPVQLPLGRGMGHLGTMGGMVVILKIL